MKLVLPIPPSLSNLRIHWSRRAPLMREFRETTFYEARKRYKKPTEPFERVRIDGHFFGWNRRDPDNLISSLKPIIDGLVDAGFIVDDSQEHLELGTFGQEIDRTHQRLELTITPIERTEPDAGTDGSREASAGKP